MKLILITIYLILIQSIATAVEPIVVKEGGQNESIKVRDEEFNIRGFSQKTNAELLDLKEQVKVFVLDSDNWKMAHDKKPYIEHKLVLTRKMIMTGDDESLQLAKFFLQQVDQEYDELQMLSKEVRMNVGPPKASNALVIYAGMDPDSEVFTEEEREAYKKRIAEDDRKNEMLKRTGDLLSVKEGLRFSLEQSKKGRQLLREMENETPHGKQRVIKDQSDLINLPQAAGHQPKSNDSQSKALKDENDEVEMGIEED